MFLIDGFVKKVDTRMLTPMQRKYGVSEDLIFMANALCTSPKNSDLNMYWNDNPFEVQVRLHQGQLSVHCCLSY